MIAPFEIGSLSDTLRPWLGKQSFSSVFLVTDENTEHLCLPEFERLTGLSSLDGAVMPVGETHKTLDTCIRIWSAMLDARVDRKSLVIVLGGGVVGDITGFCAATFLRGVRYIQVPTTLMSMTDSAIGGKTGVDFWGVKNNIGAFAPTQGIFVDPVFLKTLPERELVSGFAETIKHALIGDPDLWQNIQKMETVHSSDWGELIRRSAAVKWHIVEQDPYELDLRRLLNFGHTIGHALESYFLKSENPITHGEAVAWGMVWEARIATCPFEKRLTTLVERLYQPLPAMPQLAALQRYLKYDKKNEKGDILAAVPGEDPFSLHMVTITE